MQKEVLKNERRLL